MTMHSSQSSEELLREAKDRLVAADSILSLLFYRHRSAIPEDLRNDVEDAFVKCRVTAERIWKEAGV